MINFNVTQGQRILELGCGNNPHPQSHVRVDVRQTEHTHFTADFDEILPIQDNDFDGVYSAFVIEHLSWRKVRQFVSELFRILKPMGTAVIVTANTVAQWEWMLKNPQGWDNKPFFESVSCILFGDQDYPENTHKNFFSPEVANSLFKEAGFVQIEVHPYGERSTDLAIIAKKGSPTKAEANKQEQINKMLEAVKKPNTSTQKPTIDFDNPEYLYDKHYFNGGHKVGGYAREGYRDFFVHEITAKHILARKPESVIELGASRGYVLKKLHDAGIPGVGYEISNHCYLTRATENIIRKNLFDRTWENQSDLVYSLAFLEHIPEKQVPNLIKLMSVNCKRGLHGIDFGEKHDGFDKTKVNFKPKSWWMTQFDMYAPGWPVEIVDKEELEKGEISKEFLEGDGKLKINLGSHMVMFYHGWLNLDIIDLAEFAHNNRYKFQRHDLKNGLPFPTAGVDLIYSSHVLEHFTYEDGLKILRECRRVLKPDGCMRVIVPDAFMLTEKAMMGLLDEYNEVNDNCEKSKTQMKKLYSLLYDNHLALYDQETMRNQLEEAGFIYHQRSFREGNKQILGETIDMFPCLSLYTEATILT